MKCFECIILFFSVTISCTSAYNILGILHFPSRSSAVTFTPIFNKLAEKGHNVTVITVFPLKINNNNYKEIVLNGSYLTNTAKLNDLGKRLHWRFMSYLGPKIIAEFPKRICPMMFSSTEVQTLLKNNVKFDLVMLKVFETECVYQLAKQFECPIIGLHSAGILSWTAKRFALSINPSYIPNIYMPAPAKMNFWQRLENTMMTCFHLVFYNYVMFENDKAVVAKYFGVEEASAFGSLAYNTSIFLVNIHYTVNHPRPLVPNVVEIGGIHIGDPRPLPKDIEKWINESKHGVIYFSFGSLVKGHTMPADKRQAFINAFKRLPQRVIWKWENDTMEGKTDNILIGKWMPQFDILSHPNVKAFISHGGLLGTFEAVHCGVPVMVMPQFGDQHTNAKALESVGGGEILYLSDATEEKIYNALTKILSPSFQQQAKELSERFRDRPMSPLDTAIYWVEYVARHKGAHFMKTAAVGMPFYQYYLLDVIAFILAVLVIFFYIQYLILRTLYRLIFKKKPSTKKLKKS